MACHYRNEDESMAGCISCIGLVGEAVESSVCANDETTCPIALANASEGHVIVRAYERTETDYERPRYENPRGTDVTADRYVAELTPRPTIDPGERRKVFNLQEGDIRIQGGPHG